MKFRECSADMIIWLAKLGNLEFDEEEFLKQVGKDEKINKEN